MLAAGSFAGGILFGLFALWPLAGRDGKLWNPLRRTSSRVDSAWLDLTLEGHHAAHRRRAARKADRIVFVLAWLILGVLLALAGVGLALAFEPAAAASRSAPSSKEAVGGK